MQSNISILTGGGCIHLWDRAEKTKKKKKRGKGNGGNAKKKKNERRMRGRSWLENNKKKY